MNDADKSNSGPLCAAFHEAIIGALRGPLSDTVGTPSSVVAALLAVTADFANRVGVDFTHATCSMIAAVEPSQEKALGAPISSYASARR
jgi:hypothetical protein